MKDGGKAEADLQTALAFTADAHSRTSILATMGSNREMHLKDDAAALEAYRQNLQGKTVIGAADEFRSAQNAARILTRQGKFDEALATLKLALVEKQKGFWRHSTLLVKGDTLTAAGREEEALKAYRDVVNDGSASAALREAAEERIGKLK